MKKRRLCLLLPVDTELGVIEENSRVIVLNIPDQSGQRYARMLRVMWYKHLLAYHARFPDQALYTLLHTMSELIQRDPAYYDTIACQFHMLMEMNSISPTTEIEEYPWILRVFYLLYIVANDVYNPVGQIKLVDGSDTVVLFRVDLMVDDTTIVDMEEVD